MENLRRRTVMDQEIRPELAAFAKVMESRLKENAHRGDWRAYNFYYLAACLTANLGHMIRAFQADKPESILKSAADTANYALMISDLCGGLVARKR
jgi:hypothetical protein